jgi:hypothetical protein
MSFNEAWELFLGMCNAFNIDYTSASLCTLKHLMPWHFLKLVSHPFDSLKSPSTPSFLTRTLACMETTRSLREAFWWHFCKKENYVKKAYNYVLDA